MMFYFIKVVACSALLLVAYLLLAEKEKNHLSKRFFLLTAVVLSFVIPQLRFSTLVERDHIAQFLQIEGLQSVTVNTASVPPVSSFNLVSLLYIGYALICGYFALRFFLNLRLISSLVQNHEKIKFNNYTLVLLPNNSPPHSFLNYIFVSRQTYLNGQLANEILTHELTHVVQKHTWDILLIELIRVFCWFNPFLPFYKRAIQVNHEFLADEEVVKSCHDVKAYQYLMLQSANSTSNTTLTSAFNYLTIKKRLVMMTSKPSKKLAMLKQLGLVFTVVGATLLFSDKTSAQTEPTAVMTSMTGPAGKGISNEEMKIYNAIEKKYMVPSKNGKYMVMNGQLTATEKKTLKQLFIRMTAAQQRTTTIAFFKRPKPFAPLVPTSQQFTNFKKPTAFGIWIDGKRVENRVLDQYEASDFKHVFISKLYGKAKEGRIYTHQVDLMTKSYYDDYLAKYKTNKDELMMIFWNAKKSNSNLKVPSEDSK